MKKYNKLLLLIMLLIFITSVPVEAENNTKTIMIVLDSLDLDRAEDIVENYYGLGFLNIKGRSPSSEEGLYMSINSGRKLRVDKNQDIDFYENGEKLHIRDYDEFYNSLIKKNENIKIDLLADNMTTSFIGDDSAVLIAADKNGSVDYGVGHLEYDREWLNYNVDKALQRSDFLVMSYRIEDQENREDLLKGLINEHRDKNIMLVSRSVSKNMGFIFNKNLTPMVYIKNGKTGILESKSTRRQGFVTIEDISHDIMSSNQIKDTSIGNDIKIVDSKNPIDRARNIFRLNFNLLLIAGLFQGLTYLNQLLTSYVVLAKKEMFSIRILNRFIFINMIVGMVMGLFNFHRYLPVYLIINIGISYYLSIKLKNKDFMGISSTIIYVFMAVGIFLRSDIIYNSYFGFNNLFYGARYYGFNNGAMGIFLASSIVSYFYTKNKFNNKILKHIMVFLYFGLNMLVLSAGNAANTGGFITSVILFLTMIWVSNLEDKSNLKRVIVLIVLGVVIFAVNMYFDSKSLEKSHAIVFLLRIKESGISELLNMIKIKLKELIKYTVMPPFSIIMVLQILVIRSLARKVKEEIKKTSIIMFFISLVAFIINDTGMIAFIFINQFNIANMLSNLDLESDIVEN